MSTYVGKFFTAVSAALEFNTATLSGAMDIVVIEDTKGDRKSTPFHVRFGKLQLLKSRGIPIQVDLNGRPTPLRMLLGAAGEAYFYNPPLERSSSQASSQLSQTFESDPRASVPLPEVEYKTEEKPFVNLNDTGSSQSNDMAVPVRAASLPATKIDDQLPKFRLQSALSLSDRLSDQPVESQELDPVLSAATTVTRQFDIKTNDPADDCFENLAYASDSEVELSRNPLSDTPRIVMDAPLSPPLFPIRRSWTPDDIPNEAHQNDSPRLCSDYPITIPAHPAPKAHISSRCSPSHVHAPLEGHDNDTRTDEVDQIRGSMSPNLPEGNDVECTALFDLPAPSARENHDSSSAHVTISTSMHDIVGEEDRKLDARSLDSFDVDGNGYSSSTDGLQQRVCRILANNTSTALPQSIPSPDNMDLADSASVPTPGTDPPSERDETLVLSLCGGLLTPDMQEAQVVELFERHRVTFDEFEANPSLVFHPSLRFRIENQIVGLRVVVPFLVAALAFNEHMNLDSLAKFIAIQQESEQREELKETSKSPPTPRRFRWFGWSATPAVEGEPLLSEDEISALDAENLKNELILDAGSDDDITDANNTLSAKNISEVLKDEDPISSKNQVSVNALKFESVLESRCDTKISESNTNYINSDVIDTGIAVDPRSLESDGEKVAIPGRTGVVFTEVDPEHLSFCPTSEQLNSLDLEPGANAMRFYVEGTTVELQCRIFLWECHSKIVISDVDGTITRSDVLGHLLPAVGRDWSQVGVAGLYTMIGKNGYKMLYLTARPIGQASQTRAFLHNVTQGNSKLPNGPVLMSPNRLVESFTREVIRRRPHEFKISALREVRNLFSPDYNPFHAGFGNRDTDVISYRAVGLIPHRIFVVNPRGELVVMKAKFESTGSYSSLQDLVESVFPDITAGGGHEEVRALTDNASFNDWNFWRAQLPTIDTDNLIS